jgi:hypothetical protein
MDETIWIDCLCIDYLCIDYLCEGNVSQAFLKCLSVLNVPHLEPKIDALSCGLVLRCVGNVDEAKRPDHEEVAVVAVGGAVWDAAVDLEGVGLTRSGGGMG